jgi:hypothetical protein
MCCACGPETKSGPKFRKSEGSRPQAGRLRGVDGEVLGSASVLDLPSGGLGQGPSPSHAPYRGACAWSPITLPTAS